MWLAKPANLKLKEAGDGVRKVQKAISTIEEQRQDLDKEFFLPTVDGYVLARVI